jgi:GNAT superfamily N-acetyltransferase
VTKASDVLVRVAGAGDVPTLAALRARWAGGAEEAFEARMHAWLSADGERRTTWLAEAGGEPAGMISLFEYRRMPKPGRTDSRWGYVGNLYVRDAFRGRGIGSTLLDALIACAEERGYARLVVSPSEEALPLYRRSGFTEAADADPLLVRAAKNV